MQGFLLWLLTICCRADMTGIAAFKDPAEYDLGESILLGISTRTQHCCQNHSGPACVDLNCWALEGHKC